MKKTHPVIDPREPMLTTTEAADRLRMKRNTVMKKCAAGLIDCIHPGKNYLIPVRVVDAVLAGQKRLVKV